MYVGPRLMAVRGNIPEPCLINPRLEVDWSDPDGLGASMNYWPSYTHLGAAARAAYLDWLAGGRKDPDAYVGYVFLFFYGLERRLLHYLPKKPDEEQTTLLSDEINRLLGIYGTNSSFRRYAGRLRSYLMARRLVLSKRIPDIAELESYGAHTDMDLMTRVSIGLRAREHGIDEEAARMYIRNSDSFQYSKAGRNHPTEFWELFRHEFAAQYDALPIAINEEAEPKLVLEYEPASASFASTARANTGLVDISRNRLVHDQFHTVHAACNRQMKRYANYLGQHADAKGTLRGISRLPKHLIGISANRLVEKSKRWAEAGLSDTEQLVTPASEMAAVCDIDLSSGRMSSTDYTDATYLLEALGYGVAPDARAPNVQIPPADGHVVLFRLGDNTGTATACYQHTHHVAALMACVTVGHLSADAESCLVELNKVQVSKNPVEELHIKALCRLLREHPPPVKDLRRLAKRAAWTPRYDIPKTVMSIITKEHAADPRIVENLIKMHACFDHDATEVHNALHGVSMAGPKLVAISGIQQRKWLLPETPAEEPADTPIRLDQQAIKSAIRETAEASVLLSGVFDDKTTDEQVGNHAAVTDPSDSMAEKLAAFVSAASAQTQWEPTELTEVADKLGLPFLDAAIEAVNDAAIEACGEPLLEGDSLFEVNDYAVEVMS